MDCKTISAVIFDLDGTLLDTERATSGVLKEFLEGFGKELDAVKEDKRLGQMHSEAAKAIVRDYELPLTSEEYSKAIMPFYQQRWSQARALPGANRLIKHLHEHGIPLALASNSIRKHIDIKISHQGWKRYFSVILGGDEVSHGKPSPDIFLEAARRLGVDPSNCLVIEDSLVGVTAAKASGANVVAVPSLQTQVERFSIANSVLHSLLDFQPQCWGLPSFEDWIQDTLPIEPLFIKGLKGDIVPHESFSTVNVTADDGSYDSVPALWGVFFGWAKIENYGIHKVVAVLGWDISSGVMKRITKPYLVDHISNNIMKKKRLHLLIVGYIRKLQYKDDISGAFEVNEEDRRIGEAALELPLFSDHIEDTNLSEWTFE